VDVLQNGYVNGRVLDNSAPPAIGIPLPPNATFTTGTVTVPANGFYIARCVDQDERIGYSNPVFVA
jgi:hypothetical protein